MLAELVNGLLSMYTIGQHNVTALILIEMPINDHTFAVHNLSVETFHQRRKIQVMKTESNVERRQIGLSIHCNRYETNVNNLTRFE